MNAPADWFEGSDRRYDSFFPKSNVPAYLRVQGNELFSNFQWGIVPTWAKNQSTILTNTKSEEVLQKPTWIESFRRRRCLLPATSFFEPATVDGKKYQMEFQIDGGEPFAFAGIWQKTTAFGPPRNCCSLLTCEPNSLVGEIHGRMPVILTREQFDTYLNISSEQAEELIELLQPFPADRMTGVFEAKKD